MKLSQLTKMLVDRLAEDGDGEVMLSVQEVDGLGSSLVCELASELSPPGIVTYVRGVEVAR